MEEREKRLLINFMVFLGIVGFWYLFFPHLISKIKNQKSEILSLKSEIEEIKKTEEFAQMTKFYKENQINFQKINYLTFSKPELLQYVALVEDAASQGNVKIENFSFGRHEKSPDGEFGQLLLNISGKGGYFEFKKFLEILEKILPLMNIQTFSLTAPGELGEGEIFTFNLSLFTYTKSYPREKIAEKKEKGKEEIEMLLK